MKIEMRRFIDMNEIEFGAKAPAEDVSTVSLLKAQMSYLG